LNKPFSAAAERSSLDTHIYTYMPPIGCIEIALAHSALHKERQL
jgi:hypothetical protein